MEWTCNDDGVWWWCGKWKRWVMSGSQTSAYKLPHLQNCFSLFFHSFYFCHCLWYWPLKFIPWGCPTNLEMIFPPHNIERENLWIVVSLWIMGFIWDTHPAGLEKKKNYEKCVIAWFEFEIYFLCNIFSL